MPVPALPDSYLRAVCKWPDDDGPRLCAADWWDEQGAAERAEFVRVQCGLAVTSMSACAYESEYGSLFGTCGCRRCVLRRRERELWRAGGNTDGRGWFAGCGLEGYVIYLVPSPDDMTAVVRRGFVAELTAPAADFLAHADALLVACPLRRVRLTTRPKVEWASADVALRLAGRGWRSASELFPGDSRGVNRAMMLQAYLAAEFPGITFEMPTVEFRPGGLPPSQLPLTTDGAPALADPRTLVRGALP
jgi:uncharacterized protein (TIGR02996 family)